MPKRRLPPKDFEWTTELAYAVGLLVTDGNLSGNGRCVSLHSAEMVMINTFKKCLDLKNRTGTETKKNGDMSYRVQFSNVQFYDWLMIICLFLQKVIPSVQLPFLTNFSQTISAVASMATGAFQPIPTNIMFIKVVDIPHSVFSLGLYPQVTHT